MRGGNAVLMVRLLVRLLALTLAVSLLDLGVTRWRLASEVQALRHQNPDTTSFMRQAIRLGHPVRAREWVRLSAVAPVAACAVVLAEDEQFFEKGTVTWRSQRMLAQSMLRGDFTRGASGLPQQLARNLFLTPARTPRRKASEYVLAYEITHAVSKARLLELYLNTAEWGDGVWGIEAASRLYFGVHASSLTATQAVILASFLPAPRRGLQYVVGPLASRRQDAIVQKLWRARLLGDAEYLQVTERVREWRSAARRLRNVREGWNASLSIMGPDSSLLAALPPVSRVPLARLCDARRRGF